MARLYTSGFELNEAQATEGWDPLLGPTGAATATIQSLVVRSGAFAAKFDGGAAGAATRCTHTITLAANTTYFIRAYFCFANLPSVTTTLVTLFHGVPAAKITSAGKIQLWNLTSNAQVGSDSAATVVADSATWYRIELAVATDASAFSTTGTAVLDGVQVATGTLTTGTLPMTNFQVGWASAPGGTNPVVYVDDVALNDSTGGSQTSYPDTGKIVLLKPVSDNARGTNWTAGAGATTNLWDAIDNEPPTGKAIANATDITQIKNVVKDTTGNYDANLAAYSTAVASGGGGLVTGDTVSVVQSIWSIGEDSTSSGGVTLGMLLVSNPQANSGTETTDTPGAIAGVYPSNWKWEAPAAQIVYSPSVTLATSPVIRVGKRTNATRAAMCDFMAAYVDYVPGATGSTYTKRGYGVEHQVL